MQIYDYKCLTLSSELKITRPLLHLHFYLRLRNLKRKLESLHIMTGPAWGEAIFLCLAFLYITIGFYSSIAKYKEINK